MREGTLVEEVEVSLPREVEERREKDLSRLEEGREGVERRKDEEGDRTSVGTKKVAKVGEQEVRILAVAENKD